MTKPEIIKKLRNNWVKPGGGWRERERAERILCPKEEDITQFEFDYRIAVIVEYLKI